MKDEKSEMKDNHLMYHTQSRDTSVEAEQVQLGLLRRAGPVKRVQQTLQMSAEMVQLSRMALRRLHPDLSEDEHKLLWIEINYGKALADKARLKWPSSISNELQVRL